MDKSPHFGHGLSVAQMEEIRNKQSGKDQSPFNYIKPNRLSVVKDRFVLEQFGDYEVVEHEKNVYHVFQEARSFNSTTGEKLSVGCIQTYTVQTFNELEKAKAFKAFTHVIILHDPTIKEEKKAESTKGENVDSFGKIGDAELKEITELRKLFKEVSGEYAPNELNNIELKAAIEKLKPGFQFMNMTLDEAKIKYKSVTGKAAHHSWTIETILKKIEESGNQ